MAAVAVVAAACGTSKAGSAGSDHAAPVASIPLATSLGSTGQPAWAVVEMGGSAASHENFWELFTRLAGSAQWQLATPAGVASNGGLMMAAAGKGLVSGFGPSQDLTFSPVATLTGPSAAWSENAAPVSPGLASVPDALASGPGGELLALTRTGEVLRSGAGGTAWTRFTTLRTLRATPAGRACSLAALTAVGFTSAGEPEIGGSCARAGAPAIFEQSPGGGWRAVGPRPPVGSETVLGLATQAGRTSALLEARTPPSIRVLAAWSASASSSWTASASVGIGIRQPRSLDMWANGSVGLVQADGHGITIAGPGARWQILPALPAKTATLALGAAGQLQALAADGQWLRVWQLGAGGSWSQVQQVKIQIPYGSSS
jgi:hypothetical protein